jgi:threonine dehydrogenase-like Zn-dependent dehydrogenase
MTPTQRQGLVLLGDRSAEVRTLQLRAPGPGEVLVRIQAAGICGSDLHFYRSTPAELGIRRGVVIGHEPSGTVEAVGTDVTGFAPGDRVTVNHTLSCGHCQYCAAGETVLCEHDLGIAASGYGGDADYIILPASACFHLPPELSFIEGAFIACTGATAYGALRKLEPSGRTTIAIFGMGPVGLSALIVAKALGACVFAIDVLSERLDMARDLGADEIIDASKSNAVAALHSLSGDGRGVELTLETSGSPIGQSDAVDALRPHGKASFVGLGKGAKSISPEQFIHKEITLLGSKVLPGPLIWEMTRFMVERNVRFEPIVTHRVSLAEGPQAFARFDAGAAGKFVIVQEGVTR